MLFHNMNCSLPNKFNGLIDEFELLDAEAELMDGVEMGMHVITKVEDWPDTLSKEVTGR